MQYESRNTRSYGRDDRCRKYKERSENKKWQTEAGEKNYIRLIVCAMILLAVMAVKIFLPERADELSVTVLPIIEEDFDYEDAATAIGRSLSGDEDIVQVLGNIYSKAFKLTDEDEKIEVSENEKESAVRTLALAPTDQLHKAASRIGGQRTVGTLSAESSEEDSIEDSENTGDAEEEEDTGQSEETQEAGAAANNNEAVQSFLMGQQIYSSYGLPVNVSYDRPELGIVHTHPIVGTVSSGFGYRDHPLQGNVKFHYGTDIAADVGDTIASFADGTVTAVSNGTDSGLNVTIKHSDRISTRYCHCSEIFVSEGEVVAAGDIIAAVGATGNVTGPHLHLELKVNGTYVNSEYYLNFSYA